MRPGHRGSGISEGHHPSRGTFVMHTLLHEDVTTSVRPSRRRRVALVAAGVLSCALPTVFTLNISRMLVVGELSEHRFHQLTGQGLLLFLVWFAGLVPLLRAGWAGRRPSTAAGLLHLTFVGRRAGLLRRRPGWRCADPDRGDRGDRCGCLGRAAAPATAPDRSCGSTRCWHRWHCSWPRSRRRTLVEAGRACRTRRPATTPEPALLRHGLVGDGGRGAGSPGCGRACRTTPVLVVRRGRHRNRAGRCGVGRVAAVVGLDAGPGAPHRRRRAAAGELVESAGARPPPRSRLRAMMSTVTRPVEVGRVTGLRALGRPTPPLAGVLGTVSAALAVSALVLVTTADGWGLPAAHEVPVDAAVGIAYAGAAVLVLAGSGGRRLGWLLLVIGLAGGGAALTGALLIRAEEASAVTSAIAFVHSWLWVPGFVPLLTLVPLLYPDGRLPGRDGGPRLPALRGRDGAARRRAPRSIPRRTSGGSPSPSRSPRWCRAQVLMIAAAVRCWCRPCWPASPHSSSGSGQRTGWSGARWWCSWSRPACSLVDTIVQSALTVAGRRAVPGGGRRPGACSPSRSR